MGQVKFFPLGLGFRFFILLKSGFIYLLIFPRDYNFFTYGLIYFEKSYQFELNRMIFAFFVMFTKNVIGLAWVFEI